MVQRITIVLDTNIASRLRRIQADEIKTSSKSMSFSRVINRTLEKGLSKK